MDLGLTGRVVIVTGGSRGLGHATARVLVAEGARVVLCGRDEERAAAAAAELGGPEQALGVAADLAEPGVAERLVAAAHGRYGRLDGALVSVGGPPPGPTSALDDDVWRRAFETQFLGPLRVVRAVARQAGDEGGSIALVLSSSVRVPIEGLGASNGLRPGLAMVAKELAEELGPRGVRVNGLLPGRVDTERVRELDAATGRPAGARREREAAVPLRRYGTPEEFGRVAAFALSPAASYLTGVMLPVDGGATPGL
ncbi:SDR family oxidoreductase [Vallicoccus soli]|uniref:SDR family oxidoreductase n=1 Tax=Vallicoccus soli TaxID=2339232 RepID=A0A3A3YXR9_9ACTN|nr:SDR family oxidoreductase [Vallicoccus soli]RJK93873.1 SDR family oxidoreductase [Vallicoccus soli]